MFTAVGYQPSSQPIISETHSKVGPALMEYYPDVPNALRAHYINEYINAEIARRNNIVSDHAHIIAQQRHLGSVQSMYNMDYIPLVRVANDWDHVPVLSAVSGLIHAFKSGPEATANFMLKNAGHVLQAVGGAAEMKAGGLLVSSGNPLGLALLIHGADQFAAGFSSFALQKTNDTLTKQSVEQLAQFAMTPAGAAMLADIADATLAFAAGAYSVRVNGRVFVPSTQSIRSLTVLQRSCFVAGTPLLTPTGEKPVEEFRIGDEILSRSESDLEGPVEVKIVERVFVRTASILELRVCGQTIRTTAEHPFFMKGTGWVAAGAIKPGDQLASHDGQWVTVEVVTDLKEVATVYNLQVSDYHTYFVGTKEWGFSVWAHNANYAVLPHPNGGFALAQRMDNGTFRWVTERGTTNIRAFTSEAAAVDAIISGGGTRFTIDATTWQQYESGIRSLYGEATFGQRQFSVIVDGARVNGVADNVVEIAGRRIAVEAKFTDNWARRPRQNLPSLSRRV